MTYHSVLTKKQYEDEHGTTQTQWFKAGFMKTTDRGGMYLQLYHQPDTTFFLVPQDDDKEHVIHLDD